MAKAMVLLFALLPVACMGARIKAVDNFTEASSSSSAPTSFYLELAKLKVWGYQSMFCGDNTNCANKKNWPSPDSYVEMEAAKVAEEMAKVPARQRSGEIVRGNDLGFFILNKYLWQNDGQYQSIGLGVSVESHEYIRPIFDKILHPSQNHWNAESIAQQAKKFLESQQTFDTEGGLLPFMCKLMHKVHVDLDLDDADTSEFMNLQAAVLPKMIMPDWIPGSFDTVVETRQKFLTKYMDQMEKDTRGVFPEDMKGGGRLPGSKMYLVAAGLMDSMLFAGGLSVEGLTKTALNVLYSNDAAYLGNGDPNYHLFEHPSVEGDDVEAFVYEVARLFPAVVGFSWWTPQKDGHAYNGNQGGNTYTHRTVMNLALSLRDPRVWGETEYKQFKPRKVDFYKKHLVNAWAMDANEAGEGAGGLGNMSRGCPGQQLSMSIVTSFVREWIRQKDSWTVAPGSENGIKFSDCTPFVSSKFVKFVRGLQQQGFLYTPDNPKKDAGVKRYFQLVGNKLQGTQGTKADGTQVPDVEYDLTAVTGWNLRSEYLFKAPVDNCFEMTSRVPWGPWSGKSWETNQIFCAETPAATNEWYNALKGSPFPF